MKENREISPVEEFQTSYLIDTPSWRHEHNFQLVKCGLHILTSFQISTTLKWGKESKFIIENPDKHFFHQVISVNISSVKQCWQHVPLKYVIEMALDLCGLPLKPHISSLILGKTSDKSQLRDVLQCIWVVLNFQGLSKEKSEKLSLPRGAWRYVTSKYSVTSHMESWDGRKDVRLLTKEIWTMHGL